MLEELVEFPCMLKWRGAVACNAHAIWRVTTRDRVWVFFMVIGCLVLPRGSHSACLFGRIESVVVPLEQLKSSDFTDQQEYYACKMK